MTPLLRSVAAAEAPLDRRRPVDPATLAAAARIVEDVRARGEAALREHAERLGDLAPGAPLVHGPAGLRAALDRIDRGARRVLEATAERIGAFAAAQRACLRDLETGIPGGRAGHRLEPAARAGCYAPGGTAPLPSSVLMTAVTARAAGVPGVVVASPRPPDATLAAAAIAGADLVLGVGGAQAVAALAFGAGPIPACEVVVGPGNAWVTAAKLALGGEVQIDMLAGPSEVLVLADDSADPALIAADLLAQAEHDVEALPVLVASSQRLVAAVNAELAGRVATLPRAAIARAALSRGFAVVEPDPARAIDLCNRFAPEHLEVMTRDPDATARALRNYGALFIGPAAAEVLGDYGAGPNHVLPTGGSARWSAGLSVFTFLRARTWMRIDRPEEHAAERRRAAALARLEGLEGHARAAEARDR